MPTYCTRSSKIVTEDDGLFYAGCYVNAIIEICFMKDSQTLFAALIALQFFKDGESFTGSTVQVDESGKVKDFEEYNDKVGFD